MKPKLNRDASNEEGAKNTRSFEGVIDTRSIDEEKRTVELAFSSEEPYDRYFGKEILEHESKSMRLGRLQNGGALLVDHNMRDQVGVVVSARIDSDRKARAVVRFGRSARADEIFNDVVDGIRQLVSVGYIVHKWLHDEEADEHRAIDWEPYEISIVSIPADTTVGVGRSQTEEVTKVDPKDKTDTETEKNNSGLTKEDVRKAGAEGQRAERERVSAIQRASGDHEGADELAREAIDNGESLADFQSKLLKHIGEENNKKRAQKVDDSAGEELGLTDDEKRHYSIFRVMHALANPNDKRAQEAASFEFEVSHAGAERAGVDNPRGIFVPNEVRTAPMKRDLSTGTPATGGALVSNDLLAGSFIELLRNMSVARQAGVRVIDGLVGTVDIPRQITGSTADWLGAEDADAPESEPTFDQVSLAPKDLASYTEVTRRLTMQSTPSIEGLIRQDLIQAQALGLDSAIFYGTGSGGQPQGIAGAAGINTETFPVGGAFTYANIVSMIKKVMEDNALLGNPVFVMEANGWERASTTEIAANTAKFIISDNDTVKGRPYFNSNQILNSDVIFGNFSDAIIGLWGGMELNVDPYTHSLKGKTRFVSFQTADTAIRHPESFCLGRS